MILSQYYAITAVKAAAPQVAPYASPGIAIATAACEALERAAITCWIAPRVRGPRMTASRAHDEGVDIYVEMNR